MKKLHQFTDSLTKIKHTTYEFHSGIKFFHAQDPSSIDYVLTVTVRAGSSFETVNNLPHGTAHFLEHIVSTNPNKFLKSKFEIDQFESGNKDEPAIHTNAATTTKYMYIYSYGNEEGSNRINQRVKSILDYPIANISTYIEKERKIILAEHSHYNKEENDSHLQFNRFIYDNKESGFSHNIIGEKESIESINTKDLEAFFKKQFTPENIIITLQTGKDLLPSHIQEIETIANLFNNEPKERISPEIQIPIKKREHHFSDSQMEGISLSILMIDKYKGYLDYNEEVLEHLFRSLMRKITHDYLRKLGLIYSSNLSSNFGLSFTQRIVGYELIMQPQNFQKVLEALDYVIEKELKKFLKSKEGNVWFESMISSYIFPRTVPYRSAYAQEKGNPILEDHEVFELDKAISEAFKIKIDDLFKFAQGYFQNIPIFWIESDTDGEELLKSLRASKLYKRFKDGIS